MNLADFARTVADDDIVNLRLMTISLIEALFGVLYELTIEVIANKIDGATAETATHDTGTCHAVLLGNLVEEVQFLAAYLVVLR